MLPSGHGSTPPHHPTYNVHLSAETIHKIVSAACPGQSLLSFEPLSSGKSFNNHIYFLEVENAEEGAQKQSLVLKVSGQFFRPDKIQNEVSCFMLLTKQDYLVLSACKYRDLSPPVHAGTVHNVGPRREIRALTRPASLVTNAAMSGSSQQDLSRTCVGKGRL